MTQWVNRTHTPHLICQPVHFAPGIDKDHTLGDSQCLIQITQGVQLPLLPINIHIELLDTLQGQLISLHQNLDWLVHELPCDLECFGWHCCREHTHLQLWWKKLKNVINLYSLHNIFRSIKLQVHLLKFSQFSGRTQCSKIFQERYHSSVHCNVHFRDHMIQ